MFSDLICPTPGLEYEFPLLELLLCIKVIYMFSIPTEVSFFTWMYTKNCTLLYISLYVVIVQQIRTPKTWIWEIISWWRLAGIFDTRNDFVALWKYKKRTQKPTSYTFHNPLLHLAFWIGNYKAYIRQVYFSSTNVQFIDTIVYELAYWTLWAFNHEQYLWMSFSRSEYHKISYRGI